MHTHKHTRTQTSLPLKSQTYDFFKSCDDKKIWFFPQLFIMPPGKAVLVPCELVCPCQLSSSRRLWRLKGEEKQDTPAERVILRSAIRVRTQNTKVLLISRHRVSGDWSLSFVPTCVTSYYYFMGMVEERGYSHPLSFGDVLFSSIENEARAAG